MTKTSTDYWRHGGLEQHFPLPLRYTWLGTDPLTGQVLARLDEAFRYVVHVRGERYVITVPDGFEFDGASIPSAAWSLIGHPFGPALPAAILHDYLYSPLNQTYCRDQADELFKEILLKLEGVSDLQARLMHLAVSWFGGSHYRGGI